MKEVLKEWFVAAPWGKIALVSWGDPAGESVLLVHGRQDSLATFIPLIQLLPDKYHYVGIDMPGNGKSDAFPIGVKLSRFHFVAAVEVVLKHLAWNQFIYIGHSMGCEQGLFFNAVFPHRITKFVLLDFGPSLQRLQIQDPEEFYTSFYEDYYDNYERDNHEFKLYSLHAAIRAVSRARALSESQAQLVLQRNLRAVSPDQYKLSWDRRLKNPAPQNYPIDYYFKLFSLNAPPTLLISATDITSRPYIKGKDAAAQILDLLENNVKNYQVFKVDGGHDVHFTNPERLAHYVVDFMKKDFESLKTVSKL